MDTGKGISSSPHLRSFQRRTSRSLIGCLMSQGRYVHVKGLNPI
jgi:hypothetical protein